jgi:pimeloyl-ACP methyl ester carboxylesterase
MKYLTTLTAALLCTALPLQAAEKAISTTNGAVHLGGVLDSADAGNAPVVLVIPGSGPTDHDGNNPLGGKPQSYKLLAAALNERGITVARIDKRGLPGSQNAGVDPNNVTLAIYAGDVAAWVETLRKETHAPCIWLLGHSEGGLIAEVAAVDTPHLCGLILASSPGQPLDAVLRRQLHANLAQGPQAVFLPALDSAIDQLKKGQHFDATALPPFAKGLFRADVQGYLIDLFAHDPVADLARSKGPVLVIHGSKDRQVDPTDGARLKAARPGVESVVIDGMGHVWKIVPAGPDAGAAAIGPNAPLAPAFVDAVATFVKSRHP